jgi:hypothetical protein
MLRILLSFPKAVLFGKFGVVADNATLRELHAFSYRLVMSALVLSIAGKVFVHPKTKQPYGLIRSAMDGTSSLNTNDGPQSVFAEDSCGNRFVTGADGSVSFWEHETGDTIPLADSIEAFISFCKNTDEIELDAGKVESAWIDPAFAKSLGIATPNDGWIKKSTK